MELLGIVVGVLLALGALLAVVALPWCGSKARRDRRGRVDGAFLSPFDEIWHPAAHGARLVDEVRQELPAPSPMPADPVVPGGVIRLQG